jgi:peroxiredoxin
LTDINSAGAEIIAVSVDTIEESARLASGLGLDYPLLSDVEREAISAWGVVHEGGKPGGGPIARPATFLIEPDGTISWRSLTDNYRVRVRPAHVLEALRSTS